MEWMLVDGTAMTAHTTPQFPRAAITGGKPLMVQGTQTQIGSVKQSEQIGMACPVEVPVDSKSYFAQKSLLFSKCSFVQRSETWRQHIKDIVPFFVILFYFFFTFLQLKRCNVSKKKHDKLFLIRHLKYLQKKQYVFSASRPKTTID